MTGHQPELYHPGVWVKDFLLQRLSDETGASAIDVVVDSDGFDTVSVSAPCLTPDVRRCRQYLAVGTPASCYACAPPPEQHAIEDFCRQGDEMLATLPAPSLRRHFSEFCGALRSAAADGRTLAEVVTFARRRYEASAGTDYAELPVTGLVRGRAFATFVVDLARQADRFAAVYNAELDAFRGRAGIRSAAQPFPDLKSDDQSGRVELPLWVLSDGRRETLWVQRTRGGVVLYAGNAELLALPDNVESAVDVLRASGSLIAPKALTLTLFVRLFCCDLFIHGVGGGRYDQVTDGVCRAYYGVEPPAFVVASLTMYLPLGAHLVTEDEVSAARERLNRVEHNPDALLEEAQFESALEADRARELAAEKAALVSAIAAPAADKKALGQRIRQVNADLAQLLAPLREELRQQLVSLESQRESSEVFTDRTYPFCLWSPSEVADKVR